VGMMAKWRGSRLHECVDAKPNSEQRTPSPHPAEPRRVRTSLFFRAARLLLEVRRFRVVDVPVAVRHVQVARDHLASGRERPNPHTPKWNHREPAAANETTL
jgi:hypothetical protein